MSLPTIAITMGDPSGIGAEIIMKALAHEAVGRLCRPLVIGDAGRLEEANRIVGGTASVRRIEKASEFSLQPLPPPPRFFNVRTSHRAIDHATGPIFPVGPASRQKFRAPMASAIRL